MMEHTGCSARTDKKYRAIAQARKHPWAYYQVGKVHLCSDILIFHDYNQYTWFSKLLFHLAYWNWTQMQKQLRKSFVLIVTIEYQNVWASVNFCHLIIGPGMLPGLSNRPKLDSSFIGSPCILTNLWLEEPNNIY